MSSDGESGKRWMDGEIISLDGAWLDDQFVHFGGKLLVRVVCPVAGQVVGEVRSDARGPLLWYRINVLHSYLMNEDAPAPKMEGDEVEVHARYEVERTELHDGALAYLMVEIPSLSKRQAGGRVDPLNPFRSVIDLSRLERIVSWQGLGCERCGRHETMEILMEIRTSAQAALRSAKPHRLLLSGVR